MIPMNILDLINDGTLTIFEAARRCGIKHVVSASSSSVYGVREDGPFYELTQLIGNQVLTV